MLAIHFRLIQETGGSQGLRDLTLLESAVARPRAGYADHEFYPGVFLKAAALMESLVLNHPFVDGNKRTGIAATSMFLRVNGWRVSVSQAELVSFTLAVVERQIDVGAVAEWLRANCVAV